MKAINKIFLKNLPSEESTDKTFSRGSIIIMTEGDAPNVFKSDFIIDDGLDVKTFLFVGEELTKLLSLIEENLPYQGI